MPTWLIVLVATASVLIILPVAVAAAVAIFAPVVVWLGETRDRFGRRRIDEEYDRRGGDPEG